MDGGVIKCHKLTSKDKQQLALFNLYFEMKYLPPSALRLHNMLAVGRGHNMIALCAIIYVCPSKMLTAAVIGLPTYPSPVLYHIMGCLRLHLL